MIEKEIELILIKTILKRNINLRKIIRVWVRFLPKIQIEIVEIQEKDKTTDTNINSDNSTKITKMTTEIKEKVIISIKKLNKKVILIIIKILQIFDFQDLNQKVKINLN